MVARTALVAILSGAALLAGCTPGIDISGGDVGSQIAGLVERVQSTVDDAISDPLDANPYPQLLGGDTQRAFYATNLGDVRIDRPSVVGDLLIPGFFGPSNLYMHQTGERTLLRALIPGVLGSMLTDGDVVLFVALTDGASGAPNVQLRVGPTYVSGLDAVVFDTDTAAGSSLHFSHLALADGRVAYVTLAENDATLHVFDLVAGRELLAINADWFTSIALRDDRLATIERAQGSTDVVLRNLTDGTTIRAAVDAADASSVFLTNTQIVWSEWVTDESYRVRAFDPSDGVARVWVDATRARLTGASDTHILTEELDVRSPAFPDRIIIRKIDVNGDATELATFRADERAGQSQVLGTRAAWVNDERKIVLVPLTGGERTTIAPE